MNYLLSENDKKVLTELLSDFRTRRLNPTLRPHPDADDLFPPEVYVAKTPGGGIPAISGTTPGSAVCDIYQLVSGSLVLASGTLPYPVYNVTTTAVPAASYTLVYRDKYGNWFTQPVGGGGGGSVSAYYDLFDNPSPGVQPLPVAYNTTPISGTFTTFYFDAQSGFWVQVSGSELDLRMVPANVPYNGIVVHVDQTWGGKKTITAPGALGNDGSVVLFPGTFTDPPFVLAGIAPPPSTAGVAIGYNATLQGLFIGVPNMPYNPSVDPPPQGTVLANADWSYFSHSTLGGPPESMKLYGSGSGGTILHLDSPDAGASGTGAVDLDYTTGFTGVNFYCANKSGITADTSIGHFEGGIFTGSPIPGGASQFDIPGNLLNGLIS